MTEEKTLFEVLAEARLKMKNPVKDRKGAFNNKYASIDAILDCCIEELSRHGLSVITSTRKEEWGYSAITTLHYKNKKHSIEMPIMIEKQTGQGFMSGLTYCRRYSLTSFFSLPSFEEDDGEEGERSAEKNPKPKKTYPKKVDEGMKTELLQKQINKLKYFAQEAQLDTDRIEEWVSARSVEMKFSENEAREEALKNPEPFVIHYRSFL